MTDTHRCLIVEDDQAMAEELALLVEGLEFVQDSVDNKYDALLKLQSGNFCFVLLDLEIKRARDSIKGHVEVGRHLLREIRKQYAAYADRCHQMPILVVSGHAQEVEYAVEVMRDGADDVIQKPLVTHIASQRIRECLERSGRSKHDACLKVQAQRPTSTGNIVLTVSGERVKRRTRIMMSGRAADLTDASLRTLLHLMVGKCRGERIHKMDLGSKSDQGFQGISRLRQELERALPEGSEIIENDYHGKYWLADVVEIGFINLDALAASEDSEVRAHANKLKGLAPARSSKV